MSNSRLTGASFIVLGLLELLGRATPYDLKQIAKDSIFDFWSVPHTRIYTECERLTKAGLLEESREKTGRRRRFYKLTSRGRKALEEWRSEPTEELYENVRDLSTLKLFFGSDPQALATAQLKAHKQRLSAYLQIDRSNPDIPPGMFLALDLGINQERAFVRFWSRLARGE
jgi:PadR family transcriptional regulator AphA